MSRSPSLLLQRLALSLSTVVPELRRLEYQWVGLAKFKNFIVLSFTKARLAQNLRICCHHELRVSRNQLASYPGLQRVEGLGTRLEISLRVRGSHPRSLKVLNCPYVLWRFQNREMACKKKCRKICNLLSEYWRVAKISLQLLFVRLICPHVQLCPSRTTVSHHQMSILLFSHLKQSLAIL